MPSTLKLSSSSSSVVPSGPILDSQLVGKLKLELKMKEETIKELRNQLKHYQETQCAACLANRSYHEQHSDDEIEEEQKLLENFTFTKISEPKPLTPNNMTLDATSNFGVKNDWLAPSTTGRRQSIQLNNIYESEIDELISSKSKKK